MKKFFAGLLYRPVFWLAGEVLDEFPEARKPFINSLVPVAERVYPDDVNLRPQTIVHHLKRYWFASQFIKKGQRVLDYACGSGYGTQILQEKSNVVAMGYDINQEALDYATNHFHRPMFFYKMEWLPYNFGLITFFEAIEHMTKEEGKETLEKLKGLLAENGTLVISIPCKLDTQRNGFHKSHWDRFVLASYLGRLFKTVGVTYQDWDTGEIGNKGIGPDFYIFVCKK